MPLSPPAPRAPLHQRVLTMHGYRREDGLFDVEGHLVDTKAYGFDSDERGILSPGDALHGMWMRLTFGEDMLIVAAEAVSDFTPYAVCPQAAPNFAALAGLKIGPGFNRAVQERVGGVRGCTHLREMLGQMATVAYQTMVGQRKARVDDEARTRPPSILGSCLAYAIDSPVVARRFPAWAKVAGEGGALRGAVPPSNSPHQEPEAPGPASF